MGNKLSPNDDALPKVSLPDGEGLLYRVLAHDEEGVLRVVPQGDSMWLPKDWLDEESREEIEDAEENTLLYVWSRGPEPWEASILATP